MFNTLTTPTLLVLTLVLLTLGLASCVTSPPADDDNICSIFREKPAWFSASDRSFKKWGVPSQVQLAIIHQESRFRAKAKPPRYKLFGLIPTVRPSSAYGYAQVLDSTWDWYREKTGNGGADRNNFADAVDFIGWYGSVSQKTLGISKWDARNQYLAYHEGHGGYTKNSYRKKAWLVGVADKVDRRAKKYAVQLASCKESLNKGSSRWLF